LARGARYGVTCCSPMRATARVDSAPTTPDSQPIACGERVTPRVGRPPMIRVTRPAMVAMTRSGLG